MKRIAVDFENNAEEWWGAAREAANIPPAIRALFDTNETDVTISDDDALEVIAWAEQFPGWNDGPDYAPTALTVHEA